MTASDIILTVLTLDSAAASSLSMSMAYDDLHLHRGDLYNFLFSRGETEIHSVHSQYIGEI
jgi:hypothetical protein